VVGTLAGVRWAQPLRNVDAGGPEPRIREPRISDPVLDFEVAPFRDASGSPAFSGVVDWLDEDHPRGF